MTALHFFLFIYKISSAMAIVLCVYPLVTFAEATNCSAPFLLYFQVLMYTLAVIAGLYALTWLMMVSGCAHVIELIIGFGMIPLACVGVLAGIFMLVWFIMGNIWFFGAAKTISAACTGIKAYGMWMLITQYSLLGVVCFCAIFTACCVGARGGRMF